MPRDSTGSTGGAASRRKSGGAKKEKAVKDVDLDDYEDMGESRIDEDFKVKRLLGVWKAENYLCKLCGQVFDYSKISGSQLNCGSCGYGQDVDPKVPLRSTALVYERVTPPWWSLNSQEVEAQWMEEMSGEVTEHPEINQECPSCGNPKLQFWTRQLRSADEGLSVFFLCKKCGWRTVEK
eukprot:CAMPEP_0197654050 /NCGR_PEP_ID=MMETSP1338-20131121/38498_1 /TAXON_ID=43686 ORGANISM="Pelagodinium beii, Strain RCC1491" /NCGR_SAMPLE_ID=MMETSP1338 /ASSEMBLY_ACC=CAM_ASM_000754 /LENGTH=179 /DNA_ID=CAMNT_0043229419 /DNA_START=31 /DNA_END=570 /DNA_ORIENTATION=-